MNHSLTRRSLIYGSAAILAGGETRMPVLEVFDHLLLGVTDLDHGIDWVEKRTGVRALFGGVHPGRGTRNALLSLGRAHYLEIIAPDPAQKVSQPQFQLSGLTEPRLINFAVKTSDIGATAAALARAGVRAIGPRDGSRRTASGALLRWKSLAVESNLQSGEINPVPFFIEWASDSTHPSKDAPSGCKIEDVRFEHPQPEALRSTLQAMGLEAKVAKADQVRIVATLQTLKGQVELS